MYLAAWSCRHSVKYRIGGLPTSRVKRSTKALRDIAASLASDSFDHGFANSRRGTTVAMETLSEDDL
jgi:hypothetical protein